jgi:hypothetical protein
MRAFLCLIALLALAGCSADVTLRNPTTGATATCAGGPLAEINPWSQRDMCVESHIAEGWVYD